MKRTSIAVACAVMISSAGATQPVPSWVGAGFYVNPAGNNPTLFMTAPPGHLGWTYVGSDPVLVHQGIYVTAVPPVTTPVVTPVVTPAPVAPAPAPVSTPQVVQRSVMPAPTATPTTPAPVAQPTATPAAQPAPQAQQQQQAAKASRGSKIAGGLAMGFTFQFFMWVICDREHIEWCQAPFEGPLDDRFDQERYGVQ